ncbi:MAG: hypothetical protein ABSE62_05875 [Chthoniobacteraceae bacterium]|jgi:hypothetical protein
MKRILPPIIAALFLCGCATETRIGVYGTPGLAFTGACTGTDADGKAFTKDLDGTVPGRYFIKARGFVFTVKKVDTGNLTLNVSTDDAATASAECGASSARQGVQGKVTWWGVSLNTF